MRDRLICPGCRAPVAKARACPRCGMVSEESEAGWVFPVPEGLLDARVEAAFADLVEASSRYPWRDAVAVQFADDPFRHRLLSDPSCGDVRFWLDLSPGEPVLDIGGGYGQQAAALAMDHPVAAVDVHPSRLAFLRARLKADLPEAELFPVLASPLALPFADGTFDAVFLNGTLAALGGADPALTPAAAQARALAEARRVLKADGWLYVGIENARAYRGLLGEPDWHTGLPDLVYLPSDQADALLGHRHLSPTHSAPALLAMAEAAGFTDARLTAPYPDDRTPEALAGSAAAAGHYLRAVKRALDPSDPAERVRRLELAAVEAGSHPDFAAAFGLVAKRN